MHELARRMFELSRDPQAGVNSAQLVCDKLRSRLTRFAGADGFSALFRRALRLATTEAPGLRAITLKSDGSIQGLDEVQEEEALVLVACQLEILVTLIGERLTIRLLADEWRELMQ